jgi:hypothetical protein
MKSLRIAIVQMIASMLRVPVKVRDEFYGATKDCSSAT